MRWWLPQLGVGLFLLIFGWWIGRDHLALILHGASARGRIVAFQQVSIQDSRRGSSTAAQIPIVEYQLAGRTERFQDWLGGRRGEGKNDVVPVRYDPTRPSVAMIDRPVMNWIPWGGMAAVGIFLILVGIKALVRSLSGV